MNNHTFLQNKHAATFIAMTTDVDSMFRLRDKFLPELANKGEITQDQVDLFYMEIIDYCCEMKRRRTQ